MLTVLRELTAGDSPSYVDRLNSIVQEPDPNQQYCTLSNWGYIGVKRRRGDTAADEFDALIGFAADPASSSSLVVRAYALQVALDINAPDEPELQVRLDQLRTLQSRALRRRMLLVQNPIGPMLRSEMQQVFAQREAIARLAVGEGVAWENIFPDWHGLSFDPQQMPDNIPAQALMLLGRMATTEDTRDTDNAGSIVNKLRPLAEAVQTHFGANYFAIDDAQHLQFASVDKLSRVMNVGIHYSDPLYDFLYSEGPDTVQRIEILNELYDRADSLGDVFPESYREGVQNGARELVADALYALTALALNEDNCDVMLPLNGDTAHGLRLKLEKGEAIGILRHLVSAMRQLHVTVMDESLQTVRVNANGSFQIYRMITADSANVSAYIRPMGASTYDSKLEYGRPGEGVEASISYVIDPQLPAGSLLELGRHHRQGPDSRISIRLDLEGVGQGSRDSVDVKRDPTIEQGTLSLDVGSIIGDDDWMSTKVGRLLAWGNMLRTQSRNEQTHLNHVREHFSPEHGNASAFAREAEKLSRHYADRQIAPVQLSRRFSGSLAVASTG